MVSPSSEAAVYFPDIHPSAQAGVGLASMASLMACTGRICEAVVQLFDRRVAFVTVFICLPFPILSDRALSSVLHCPLCGVQTPDPDPRKK